MNHMRSFFLRLAVASGVLVFGNRVDAGDEEALRLFDQMCVQTSLEKKRFEANARVLSAAQIDSNQLKLFVDAEIGYVIRNGTTVAIASWGWKKTASGSSKKNCTLSVVGMKSEGAKQLIERHYKVHRILDERQAGILLVLYEVELFGDLKSKIIGIQYNADANDAITFSLFEKPD